MTPSPTLSREGGDELTSKGANLRFNPISELLPSGYKKIKIDTSVKKQTEILFDERGRSSNSVI